jgi:platelet-activating factor acetylhydrolase IB subunit alpha
MQMSSRHKSIIAYLSANNLPKSAAALREEVGLGEDVYDVVTAKKYETLLEKKWTSIVRLQKKVWAHSTSLILVQLWYAAGKTDPWTTPWPDHGP